MKFLNMMIRILKILYRVFYLRLFRISSEIQSRLSYFFLSKEIKQKLSRRLFKKNSEDLINFEYENVCIFASYSNKLSLSTKYYIKKFIENNYKVIHINNAKTSKYDLNFLIKNKCLIFDRLNIGRDVGAYRDGFLYLKENKFLKSIKNLCFTNDSFQIIPGNNLIDFFEKINAFHKSENLILSSHKSLNPFPHYQSYFFILKPDIFLKKEFIKFIKNYTPFNSKNYSIFNYEIEISKKFFNKIDRSITLYSSSKLVKQNSSLLNTKEKDFVLNMNIEKGNPTHTAAFIFPKYLKCPILKKDLCSSGSYTFIEVLNFYKKQLELSGIDQKSQTKFYNEFSEILYKKGKPNLFF